MKRFVIFGLAIILLIALFIARFPFGVSNVTERQTDDATSPTTQSPSNPQDAPRISTVVTGLDVPWALAFLPNGDMLVTERKGTVRRVDQSGTLQEEPVATIDNVKQYGEGGLHGIAIHPDFESNSLVYLYYTYAGSRNSTLNRVVRMKYSARTLSDEEIIINNIPGGIFHDGGRIKFGPDRLLYIATGDATEPSLSQNRNSLAGKILRATDTGEAPSDNPFNTLTYSYGHRNPQGLAWDNQGQLFATEHGQTATDELNRIIKGGNYGWPTIRGDETRGGMITPVLHSGSTTYAPSGMTYINGSLYFAGLRGESLFQVTITEGNAELKRHFENEYGRLREVVAGPDGMLYVTTNNRDGRGVPSNDDDKILKINPSKL